MQLICRNLSSFLWFVTLRWDGVLSLHGKTTSASLGTNGTVFLIAGGIAYTIGAVFYAFGKKHRYIHSVFHIFCVAGSILHTICILFYVV